MMKKNKTKARPKDPNVYPPGWDYRRAKAVADYYDARKDQEFLADIEPGAAVELVWMEIPQELVPQVHKLLARRRKSA
jgi:hypothetical protein